VGRLSYFSRLAKEKEIEKEKRSSAVTLNDALSRSWHGTIIFSERQGIERDSG